MNPSVFILEDNPAFAEALIKMIENYPIRIDYTYAANLNMALRKIDEAVHYTAFLLISHWMITSKIPMVYPLQNSYRKSPLIRTHLSSLQPASLTMFMRH